MRVNAYIDGFNLYYAIKQLKTPLFKWIDLKKLCENYLKDSDQLIDVYLFTALVKYNPANPQQTKRQKIYLKAQQSRGIKIILGRFKSKYPFCKNCNTTYHSYEEKESDINIAIQLIEDAYENRFDKAFVITADTDLSSTLSRVRMLFPQKNIILLVPPLKLKEARDLTSCNRWIEIKKSHIKKSLLPENIYFNGEKICIPQEWR
ncbi:hypothetical protein BBW65_05810 [Helicobacter enhydrae]|uniref:NYN domain-containing protein n=1 Tax=Helicobacter enhydrae TaxID=222136 RepID=A0A1B1U6N2_9HELI|nr:NYN domain-containing protein [Helicobacter enhydrae]ANV98345.1 hypothetical protein BBW65_05810 [Helicobacter enhydrae]